MMRVFFVIFICLFFVSNNSFSQSKLSSFQGIWISKPFFNSFEKTRNIRKSKKSFTPEFPVALRINFEEIYNDSLNVGYSVLHDHFLHPEVSRFYISKDTTLTGVAAALYEESDDKSNKDLFRRVYEQGHFSVSLNLKETNNWNVGYIEYFNFENQNSFLGYYIKDTDTTLFIHRLKNDTIPADTIYFTKTDLKISKNYPSPNPLYYYTRNRTLVGNYNLYDNNGNILSTNFRIENNGEMVGYKPFENIIFIYSTDVYCGYPWKFNTVNIVCKE